MNAQALEKLLEQVTPGPWVDDNNEGYGASRVWAKCAPDGTPGPCVASVIGDSAEAEANAALITLAPTIARRVIAAEKLAEALRESQLQIEYLHERLGGNTGSGNAVYAHNAAALAEWGAAQ